MKLEALYTKRELEMIQKALSEYSSNHFFVEKGSRPWDIKTKEDAQQWAGFLQLMRLYHKIQYEVDRARPWPDTGDMKLDDPIDTNPCGQWEQTKKWMYYQKEPLNDLILMCMEKAEDPDFELEKDEQFEIERNLALYRGIGKEFQKMAKEGSEFGSFTEDQKAELERIGTILAPNATAEYGEDEYLSPWMKQKLDEWNAEQQAEKEQREKNPGTKKD